VTGLVDKLVTRVGGRIRVTAERDELKGKAERLGNAVLELDIALAVGAEKVGITTTTTSSVKTMLDIASLDLSAWVVHG
jgi:hypothetical protein